MRSLLLSGEESVTDVSHLVVLSSGGGTSTRVLFVPDESEGGMKLVPPLIPSHHLAARLRGDFGLIPSASLHLSDM